jgi:hypothetical protein
MSPKLSVRARTLIVAVAIALGAPLAAISASPHAAMADTWTGPGHHAALADTWTGPRTVAPDDTWT